MRCRLDVVVPCFNEEEVLPEAARRLSALLASLTARERIASTSRIWFVDDGSKDGTWAQIEALAQSNPAIGGIKLSRNQGQQNALLAGLLTSEGDVVASLDADLQDDISVIPDMLDLFDRGIDVVYGVRNDRSSDSVFKRASAQGFYRLLNALGIECLYNHADFRLLSRRAVEALKEFREVNLFLRGIVPLLGFKSSVVRYDRPPRFAGASKYSVTRMAGLALNALTSFSVVPLRLISMIGFSVFALSVAMIVWTIWIKLFSDRAVPGWASTLLPIYTLGGIQILCIGVIGEYIARVYQEVKARPRFIIEKLI